MEHGQSLRGIINYVELQTVQKGILYFINQLVSSYCGNPSNYDIPQNSTENNVSDLIYGINNFDNIGSSVLTLF